MNSEVPEPEAPAGKPGGQPGDALTINVFCLLWRNEQYVEDYLRSLLDSLRRCPSTVRVVLTCTVNGPDGEPALAELERVLGSDAAALSGRLQVDVMRSPTNLGYAGGMNHNLAGTQFGSIVVFANMDGTLDGAFLPTLASLAAESDQAKLFIPAIVDSAGHTSAAEDWDFLLTSQPVPGPPRRGPCRGGPGACMIATSAAVRRRLDEWGEMFWGDLFTFSEDEELFLWAERAGVPLIAEPALRMVHHQGGSFEGGFRLRQRSAGWVVVVVANHRAVIWLYRRSFRFGAARLALWDLLTLVRLAQRWRWRALVLWARSLRRTRALVRRYRDRSRPALPAPVVP